MACVPGVIGAVSAVLNHEEVLVLFFLFRAFEVQCFLSSHVIDRLLKEGQQLRLSNLAVFVRVGYLEKLP